MKELHPEYVGDPQAEACFQKFFSNVINDGFLEEMNIDYEWVGSKKFLMYPNKIGSDQASIDQDEIVVLNNSAIIDDEVPEPIDAVVVKKRSLPTMLEPDTEYTPKQKRARLDNDPKQSSQQKPLIISFAPFYDPSSIHNKNKLVARATVLPQKMNTTVPNIPITPVLPEKPNEPVPNIPITPVLPQKTNEVVSSATVLPQKPNEAVSSDTPVMARLVSINGNGILTYINLYEKARFVYKNINIMYNEFARTCQLELNISNPASERVTINQFVVQPGSKILLFDGDTIIISNTFFRFERTNFKKN